jgi:GDPmannose 4,6-dehydratase
VREFCEVAFGHLGLDSSSYVRQDPRFFRPVDISETRGDATKAREELGWAPKVCFRDLVVMMVDSQVERLAREEGHRRGHRPNTGVAQR